LKVIPVFIPQAGCPHQCVFCNQKTISGESETSIENAQKQIEKYIQWLKPSVENQLAFFGGSFTALSSGMQEELLMLSDYYIRRGDIGSVRVSTRPDYVDEERLALLQKHHVTLVELGVQSLDDKVLQQAGRGHLAEDVYNAVAVLRENGMQIGIQLMLGLPGQNWVSLFHTVEKVLLLRPHIARIYPVLVIKGTALAEMFLRGTYSPLTMDVAMAQASYVYVKLSAAGIAVIRTGLQADEEICAEGNIIAGPFHPSFGEMAESFSYKSWVSDALDDIAQCGREIIIKNPRKMTSKIKGLNRRNEVYWQQKYGKEAKIVIREENETTEAVFSIRTQVGEVV